MNRLTALLNQLRAPWLQLRLAALATALIAAFAIYAISHKQPQPAGVQPTRVLAMELSPDGEYLAVAMEDGTLEIRRGADNRVLHRRHLADRPVRDLAMFNTPASDNNPASTRLIIADAAGSVEILMAETARTQVPRSAFPESLTQPVFAISDDGIVWVSGSNAEGGWLARLPPEASTPELLFNGPESEPSEAESIGSAALEHGAEKLLAPRAGSVILDVPFGEALFFQREESASEAGRPWQRALDDEFPGQIYSMENAHILKASAKGFRVFSTAQTQGGSAALPVQILANITDPVKTEYVLEGHEDLVLSAAFSPDGSQIVSGSYDNTVRVWEAASGAEPLKLKDHEDGVTSVAYSPVGRRLSAGLLMTRCVCGTPRRGQSC